VSFSPEMFFLCRKQLTIPDSLGKFPIYPETFRDIHSQKAMLSATWALATLGFAVRAFATLADVPTNSKMIV